MDKISFAKDELAEFCRRNHVLELSLFGSVLREDFRPDSDVDVLVVFEDGHVPGFFGLARMEEELSELFGGRRVDLRTRVTSAGIFGKTSWLRPRFNMQESDRIRLRHMLDSARRLRASWPEEAAKTLTRIGCSRWPLSDPSRS